MKTRFPPEPNGFLHIGHVKAMIKDFNSSPNCILRFDDTNPLAEKQCYVDAAINDIQWLGFKPVEITYTSDYFEELYEIALKLIKLDKAFIDSSTAAEINAQRGGPKNNPYPSPDRNRPIEDSLRIFKEMKEEKYLEGTYTLRLKIDATSPNPCLRDPIAYRIIYASHYRTGSRWCIYPSYDFSHSLVDSLEEITHSYCTREFFIRRDQYYWTIDTLGMFRPLVEEFNRLNIEGVQLSKRKIIAQVEAGEVTGFDDPRLFTIAGLRNRGFPPEAIVHFVQNHVEYALKDGGVLERHKFDFGVREYLNDHCVRRFGVKNPLKVNITNLNPDDPSFKCEFLRPDDPNPNSTVGRTVKMSNVVYIDHNDFKLEAEKKYKRLAPGKEVRLRYYGIVKYVNHIVNEDGVVTSVTIELLDKVKTKGAAIHWVPETDAIDINVHFPDENIHRMMKCENNLVVDDVVQFERVGYAKILAPDKAIMITELKNSYKKSQQQKNAPAAL